MLKRGAGTENCAVSGAARLQFQRRFRIEVNRPTPGQVVPQGFRGRKHRVHCLIDGISYHFRHLFYNYYHTAMDKGNSSRVVTEYSQIESGSRAVELPKVHVG